MESALGGCWWVCAKCTVKRFAGRDFFENLVFHVTYDDLFLKWFVPFCCSAPPPEPGVNGEGEFSRSSQTKGSSFSFMFRRFQLKERS